MACWVVLSDLALPRWLCDRPQPSLHGHLLCVISIERTLNMTWKYVGSPSCRLSSLLSSSISRLSIHFSSSSLPQCPLFPLFRLLHLLLLFSFIFLPDPYCLLVSAAVIPEGWLSYLSRFQDALHKHVKRASEARVVASLANACALHVLYAALQFDTDGVLKTAVITEQNRKECN